ncbi:proto-oncogene Mas-like isoform X2 [Paroedura picta]|uniref:proto-oncogene Mas-like isoform X2 n=1 Tax=Paroedura picta TaxID=143630 RepID=UPI004056BB76
MANASSIAPPVSGKENTHALNESLLDLVPLYSATVEFNDTGYYDDWPVYAQTMGSLTVLSSLCGLVGNGTVIWLLSFCIKRNPFTTYILNLAIADLGTLLCLSLRIITYYTHVHVSLLFLEAFLCFTYSASLYFLTAISHERCLSVLFPIWYRCHRPGRSSAVVSCLLWIITGLLSGTLYLLYDDMSFKSYMNVLNTVFIVNLLVFTPVMIASTLIMSITICCSSQRRQPPRLYITLSVTVLLFIIFAVPLSAMYFVLLNTDLFPALGYECSHLLASFNSSINPIIYYFAGRKKKKGGEPLNVVLKRAFRDEAMGQGGA